MKSNVKFTIIRLDIDNPNNDGRVIERSVAHYDSVSDADDMANSINKGVFDTDEVQFTDAVVETEADYWDGEC